MNGRAHERNRIRENGTIMPKTVGILGGMGPKSTVELMHKIIDRTPAQKDQDHIRILVDNRPQIPDRTNCILGNGPSPLSMMQDSVQMLEKWGAEMVAIACNTAHYFVDDIQSVVTIPVINMIELLSCHLNRTHTQDQPVLLLATTGSLKINLYQKYLKGFELVIPQENIQRNMIMEAIYEVKANGNNASSQRKILDAIDSLSARKPVCVIAGCTEIGIALQGITSKIPIINPLDLLADDIVERAFA